MADRINRLTALGAKNITKPLLAKRQTLSRGHHAAMPIDDVPEFAILTAARTGEAIGATWGEIDVERRLWIVPPHRMKAQREHRVPLSDRALV